MRQATVARDAYTRTKMICEVGLNFMVSRRVGLNFMESRRVKLSEEETRETRVNRCQETRTVTLCVSRGVIRRVGDATERGWYL